ncbi:MAG: signal peptide peptidase SppA [Planctomycetota bacterium]
MVFRATDPNPTRRPIAGWVLVALAVLLPALPVVAASAEPSDADEPHAIRIVRPKGLYADHPTAGGFDPMSLLLGGGGPTRSFPALCERLLEFAADPEIDSILFDLSAPFSMNLPQLSELRRVLQRVSAAGKGTMAWIENGALPHLAIGSSCDRILMADFGTLDVPSLGMSAMHFKDAMDLLGVEASVARVGDFKGAVEPYTRSEISDHLREHYRAMLSSMNDSVVLWMVEGRGMTTSEVRSIQADRMFTATAGLERGRVDTHVPYGSMEEMVESEFAEGVEWRKPGRKVQPPPNFFEVFSSLFGVTPKLPVSEPSIAVLHLDGQIMDGETAVPGSMISGPTVKAIERLAQDENIRGVVVRINSPGGSATASEAIRQALIDLKAVKPVVISMGTTAASGGYWISCLGQPIYAEAGTITGSIGVFAMKLSFGPLMSRYGLRVTPINLDDTAGAMEISRGWSPRETERIELLIGEVYDRFLAVVGESRGMSVEEVGPIAGGRVWSGHQALDLGLVDAIGGTESAVAHVARLAGLPADAPVIHRPDESNPLAGFDLFGTGGEEEIRMLRGIDTAPLLLLRELGFDLIGHLRQALDISSHGSPKVMMLAPTQIVVH